MPVRPMWDGKFHSSVKRQISAENLETKSRFGRGDDRFGLKKLNTCPGKICIPSTVRVHITEHGPGRGRPLWAHHGES